MKTARECSRCGKEVENKHDWVGWIEITYNITISMGYTTMGRGRSRGDRDKKDFCGLVCFERFFNELATRVWE